MPGGDTAPLSSSSPSSCHGTRRHSHVDSPPRRSHRRCPPSSSSSSSHHPHRHSRPHSSHHRTSFRRSDHHRKRHRGRDAAEYRSHSHDHVEEEEEEDYYHRCHRRRRVRARYASSPSHTSRTSRSPSRTSREGSHSRTRHRRAQGNAQSPRCTHERLATRHRVVGAASSTSSSPPITLSAQDAHATFPVARENSRQRRGATKTTLATTIREAKEPHHTRCLPGPTTLPLSHSTAEASVSSLPAGSELRTDEHTTVSIAPAVIQGAAPLTTTSSAHAVSSDRVMSHALLETSSSTPGAASAAAAATTPSSSPSLAQSVCTLAEEEARYKAWLGGGAVATTMLPAVTAWTDVVPGRPFFVISDTAALSRCCEADLSLVGRVGTRNESAGQMELANAQAEDNAERRGVHVGTSPAIHEASADVIPSEPASASCAIHTTSTSTNNNNNNNDTATGATSMKGSSTRNEYEHVHKDDDGVGDAAGSLPLATEQPTSSSHARHVTDKAAVMTDMQTMFDTHFEHGKVHHKPPWYLCACMEDNHEHPYYVDWLDGVVIRPLAEQLRLSRERVVAHRAHMDEARGNQHKK